MLISTQVHVIKVHWAQHSSLKSILERLIRTETERAPLTRWTDVLVPVSLADEHHSYAKVRQAGSWVSIPGSLRTVVQAQSTTVAFIVGSPLPLFTYGSIAWAAAGDHNTNPQGGPARGVPEDVFKSMRVQCCLCT